MGCISSSPGDAAARKADAVIQSQMKRDAQKEGRKIKLLLLGTGESGKSTILKQVKVLYGDGLTDDENKEWIPRIRENINKQVISLIEGAKIVGIDLPVDLTAPFGKGFVGTTPFTQQVADSVKALWADSAAQEVWELRAQYQILDSLEYYVEHVDRIASEDFYPEFQDVVMARVRTSGIVTESFAMENIPFELYDVGGQRSERKKWINCFDNVTSIIFVAAINEYDQKLFEDSTTDRIVEAVSVFEEVVNNPSFRDIGFVVFMNKYDLFQQKLFQYPFRVADGPTARNVSFEGPYAEDLGADASQEQKDQCVEAAALYTQARFEEVANTREGLGAISYYHTNATDSRNMKLVFNTSKDQILRLNLNRSGFGG